MRYPVGAQVVCLLLVWVLFGCLGLLLLGVFFVCWFCGRLLLLWAVLGFVFVSSASVGLCGLQGDAEA